MSAKPYTRNEPDNLRVFYKSYAPFQTVAPTYVQDCAKALEASTQLPRSADDYPINPATIQLAARAVEALAKKLFEVEISVENPAADQLDDLICSHLIDPALRPFFSRGRLRDGAEVTEEQQQEFWQRMNGYTVPNEPLLYYCLGCFWGEWLVHHRGCAWRLFAPLNPLQSFPDMISAYHTICLMPFSQVVKKFSDLAGDYLAYKAHVSSGQKRYLPPYPLLASISDAGEAVKSSLPAPAAEALEYQEQGNEAAALRAMLQAINADPENLALIALAMPMAWRQQQMDLVVPWLDRLVQAYPDHPMFLHNRALFEPATEAGRRAAIDWVRRALKADPSYARAHITLASFLNDLDEKDEAREHLKWVIEHDPNLKQEASEFLASIR